MEVGLERPMPGHSLVVGLPLRQDLRHSRSEPSKVVNRVIQHLFHCDMVCCWSVTRQLLWLKSCDAVVEVTKRGACAGSAGKVSLKLGVEQHLPGSRDHNSTLWGATFRYDTRQRSTTLVQPQTSVDKSIRIMV